MTIDYGNLPYQGEDKGLFINPKGVSAREYVNARREIKIDVEHTAVLSLHVQNSTVQLTGVTDEMLDRIGTVLKGARQIGMMVVHQTSYYREGYPEGGPRNKTLTRLKPTGVLQPGMKSGELHEKAAALPNEPIVRGPRISSFVENDMGAVLRARDITGVVLMGPSTGGAIVGTMSSAADLDYETIILEDCCIDTDLELHNVLIRQLFPRRATVMTAQEFLQKIGVA